MLTDAQLARRTQGITATDVVALAGLSPYRSPLDVWLDKQGQAPGAPSMPARIGHRLEAVICDLYAEGEPGVMLAEPGTVAHPTLSWALATPDRQVLAGQARSWLLEAKSRSYQTAQGFGEPGTDQVPADVLAQVHWQLFVTGLDRCDVALLVDARDFRVYRVQADPEAADLLRTVAERFWFAHVVPGVAPPLDGSPSAHRYLADRYRSHTEEIALATREEAQLIAELGQLRARRKAAEAAEATVESLLKDAIGDRAGLVSPVGHRVTWRQTRDATVIDWRGIVEDLGASAEVVAQHTAHRPGSRRFLATFAEEGAA